MPKPVTATMLRRVAEAADGIRDNQDVWFVAAFEFPHHLLKSKAGEWYFDTEAEAQAAAMASGPDEYHVFGPYRTPGPDPKNRVRITVTTASGSGGEVDVEGGDLLVWSASAFDKFVAPYYYQMLGPTRKAYGEIAEMRRELLRTGWLLHRWPTIMRLRLDES